eukprot:Amastigsp_a175813_123.p3 type:complete len:113 gc:universal Amastigsp_a175813_123:160-498(+)
MSAATQGATDRIFSSPAIVFCATTKTTSMRLRRHDRLALRHPPVARSLHRRSLSKTRALMPSSTSTFSATPCPCAERTTSFGPCQTLNARAHSHVHTITFLLCGRDELSWRP